MLKEYLNILIESCGWFNVIMCLLFLAGFLISTCITIILITKFFLKGCNDYDIYL